MPWNCSGKLLWFLFSGNQGSREKFYCWLIDRNPPGSQPVPGNRSSFCSPAAIQQVPGCVHQVPSARCEEQRELTSSLKGAWRAHCVVLSSDCSSLGDFSPSKIAAEKTGVGRWGRGRQGLFPGAGPLIASFQKINL